jgi:hypothetical protein
MMRTLSVTVAVIVCALLTSCSPPRSDRPVIGAKNFTEQVILGELLAQEIEAKSDLKVERRFYLAGSYICQQALVAGRIDAYVEYTGTALTAILKQPVDRDPESVLRTVRQALCLAIWHHRRRAARFRKHLRHGDPRRRCAALHLTTLSQAAKLHRSGILVWVTNLNSARTVCPGSAKLTDSVLRARRARWTWGCSIARSQSPGRHDRRQLDGRANPGIGSDRAPGRQALFSSLPGCSAGARRCAEALAPDSKRPYRPCRKSHSGRRASHEPGR